MVISILQMQFKPLPPAFEKRDINLGAHPTIGRFPIFFDEQERVWVLPNGHYRSNKYNHFLTTEMLDYTTDFSYILIVQQLYNSSYGTSRRIWLLVEEPEAPEGYRAYLVSPAWKIASLKDAFSEKARWRLQTPTIYPRDEE